MDSNTLIVVDWLVSICEALYQSSMVSSIFNILLIKVACCDIQIATIIVLVFCVILPTSLVLLHDFVLLKFLFFGDTFLVRYLLLVQLAENSIAR